MTIRQKVGAKVGLAAVAAFAAAFLPWGMARVEDDYSGIVGYVPSGAWTSSFVVAHVPVPNFLPSLVALALAGWAWIDPRLGRRGAAPVLAAYGALHGLLAARMPVLGNAGGGGFAPGPLVVLAAFTFMLIAMTGVPDEPETVAQAPERGPA